MAEDKDARRGPLERLASAFGSSDLALRPRGAGDADVLVASGLTALQLGPVASTLIVLHSGHTQGNYRAALVQVQKMVRFRGQKLGWRLNKAAAHRVGELALAHHLHPACPHCKGRGKLAAEGTPYLTANICTHCRGSGERPIQRKHHEQIDEMVRLLGALVDRYAGHMGAYLR